MRKDEADAILQEEPKTQAPPTPPKVELESDRIRLELVAMESAKDQKVASGSASHAEVEADLVAIEKAHFELRKALFREQAGSEQLFMQTLAVFKQNKIPEGVNLVEALPKMQQIIERVKASSEACKADIDKVRLARAHQESIRKDIQRLQAEIMATQSLISRNNEAIKKEDEAILNLYGDCVEKAPLWVAYEAPDTFQRLTGAGILISSSATPPPNSTSMEKSVGAKPTDLTPDEHKTMLERLAGEPGKQLVESAAAEGASRDSNKEILDKVSMKVFGKTFAHYGSLDTAIYNIRGKLGWRS